ncbi:MAG: DUF262 domain-containing protein [Flavobacteriaceae bacterium]|nr:DUF262 domain-containing protein [Flavobacteriaceae bacterium]
MSKNKSMEEVSVEQLISNYNLVVPEIQREYVWGLNTHGILDTFISDIKEGYKSHKNDESKSNKELEVLNKLFLQADDLAKDSIKKMILGLGINESPINIGFLYSYRPDYYVYNDRNEDVYLIDGQQRFTTLFFMLFYLSIKENRKEDFIELFRFNKDLEQIAFDYRVRTLTHDFFIDLINNSNSIDDLQKIQSKNWFLSNYKNDITVNSIVGSINGNSLTGTLPILHNHFEDDNNKYFDYVKTQIKFWHFKTEETSQGEELYITMNSRGQQLADNENIRAMLFEEETIKENQLEWSEKWENWQDFFWKHRNKKDYNSSADNGFNEFLRWVCILEMFNKNVRLEDEDGYSTDLKKLIKGDNKLKLPVEYLGVKKIEQLMNAVKYLFDDFPDKLRAIKGNYTLYKNFTLISDGWLSSKEKGLTQIELFRLLPVLQYISIRLLNDITVDDLHLFRIIRFFYNLRQDETVGKTPDVQLLNALDLVSVMGIENDDIISTIKLKGISKSLLNKEETKKLTHFKNVEERQKIETLFWISEDHKEAKGKIIHIIELAERACSEFHKKFDSEVYFKIHLAYRQLILNHSKIWGNFLNTKLYNANTDRVLYALNLYKNEDYLDCAYERYKKPEDTLEVFFEQKQKLFIREYAAENEMFEETSYKKQLYLYYILNTQIKGEWIWGGNWNFGVYNNNEDYSYHSLFKDNKIFQKYRQQWRYSFGYNPQNGICTQHNYDPDFNYFQELINWANK